MQSVFAVNPCRQNAHSTHLSCNGDASSTHETLLVNTACSSQCWASCSRSRKRSKQL